MKHRFAICTLLLVAIVLLCNVAYLYYKDKNPNMNSTIVVKNSVKSEPKELDAMTLNDIEKYINRKGKTLLVIGKTGCSYCNAFMPILRNASSDYNFDYMYIDLTKLTKDDYSLLFDSSQIMIPAKCNDTGTQVSLKSGFGTPLSLFFENGTVYDCIRGYKDSAVLYEILAETKYIQ